MLMWSSSFRERRRVRSRHFYRIALGRRRLMISAVESGIQGPFPSAVTTVRLLNPFGCMDSLWAAALMNCLREGPCIQGEAGTRVSRFDMERAFPEFKCKVLAACRHSPVRSVAGHSLGIIRRWTCAAPRKSGESPHYPGTELPGEAIEGGFSARTRQPAWAHVVS